MGSPFVGELRLFGGSFAPLGWAFCNGQLMSISEFPALFQLVGTTYGGDGTTTFGLPDLQGRVPLHQGQGPGLSNRVMGEKAGTPAVTLTQNQIASHTHTLNATNTNATNSSVANNLLTATPTAAAAKLYTNQTGSPTVETLSTRACGVTGGSQPHDNMMPSLSITYIISLQGIFPTQN